MPPLSEVPFITMQYKFRVTKYLSSYSGIFCFSSLLNLQACTSMFGAFFGKHLARETVSFCTCYSGEYSMHSPLFCLTIIMVY